MSLFAAALRMHFLLVHNNPIKQTVHSGFERLVIYNIHYDYTNNNNVLAYMRTPKSDGSNDLDHNGCMTFCDVNWVWV